LITDMKIIMPHPVAPSRGIHPVEVGNVYFNSHGRDHYKIVVAVRARGGTGSRSFNNCVLLKVNHSGEIVSAGCEPEQYLKNHQDLVGKVYEMPTIQIDLFKLEL
jgi:hypothetical protein